MTEKMTQKTSRETTADALLPAGWKCSEVRASTMRKGQLVAIQAPTSDGHGTSFVTIDFESRVFAGDFGAPSKPLLDSTYTYEHRKWRDSIVTDAANWLKIHN
jgi:hypothetical protein